MGNVKKSYRSEELSAARADHLPDSPGPSSSPTAEARAALLRRNPWAAKVLAELRSSTNGPSSCSEGSESDSARAGNDSRSSGTPTRRDRRNSDGAGAAGASPSARIHAPGQPFFELRNLVEDQETPYSDGLAMLVARFGDIPTMRAFKARPGWMERAAAENSWLSGALLGRRAETRHGA